MVLKGSLCQGLGIPPPPANPWIKGIFTTFQTPREPIIHSLTPNQSLSLINHSLPPQPIPASFTSQNFNSYPANHSLQTNPSLANHWLPPQPITDSCPSQSLTLSPANHRLPLQPITDCPLSGNRRSVKLNLLHGQMCNTCNTCGF